MNYAIRAYGGSIINFFFSQLKKLFIFYWLTTFRIHYVSSLRSLLLNIERGFGFDLRTYTFFFFFNDVHEGTLCGFFKVFTRSR